MKIHVHTEGDSSVGISGDVIVIDWNLIDIDDSIREEYRLDIGKFFSSLCDNGPARVWFDDECPDCLQKLTDGICRNKGCIRWPPGDCLNCAGTQEPNNCVEAKGKGYACYAWQPRTVKETPSRDYENSVNIFGHIIEYTHFHDDEIGCEECGFDGKIDDADFDHIKGCLESECIEGELNTGCGHRGWWRIQR